MGRTLGHMRADLDDLSRMFPYFGDYPLSARIALWDRIYNLGAGRLRREFPLMQRAISDGDWEEAARQSHRMKISDERNQDVFDPFMDASKGL